MKERKRYFRFTYQEDEQRTVTKVPAETNLDNMVEALQTFLKACGYHLPGRLEIVEEQSHD